MAKGLPGLGVSPKWGHSAAFYRWGNESAASLFTTVPVGLTSDEHVAWH